MNAVAPMSASSTLHGHLCAESLETENGHTQADRRILLWSPSVGMLLCLRGIGTTNKNIYAELSICGISVHHAGLPGGNVGAVIDLFSMVTRPVVSLCVRHGDESGHT